MPQKKSTVSSYPLVCLSITCCFLHVKKLIWVRSLDVVVVVGVGVGVTVAATESESLLVQRVMSPRHSAVFAVFA